MSILISVFALAGIIVVYRCNAIELRKVEDEINKMKWINK